MNADSKIGSVPENYRSSLREDMIEFMPSSYHTVLEIGCGEGAFSLNLLPESEYWGVESDSAAIIIGKGKNPKAHFINGNFPLIEEELPDNYFDVIVCNDIIEHIDDTQCLLKYIKKKMKRKGVLVASIPNVRHISVLNELLIHKNWKYKDSGILDRTHLRFFTKKSMVDMLCENGFEVEKIKGINSLIGECNDKLLRLKRLIKYSIPIFILGGDTKYLQFGIKAGLKKQC
ncbi:hypothetical protein BCT86_00200 [Vibrio breoganii]|uniref:class I SAM-dependent methyltransferase n=1 Tax=Vibrio breoganii TaxID=553239 RepID=UPI000C82548B|nr:class I SAM-dependent methyltransferase [Vibrio breoganii]PML10634.1 hypothetical protein BCT86_00200 [Vibrio breoganii]